MADDKKLSTGRLARLAKLASMSAKLSGQVVTRSVKRFTGGDDDELLMGAGAAEKLVATLGDLKGLAMKIGQQISMDPDLLTPEVRAIVARLQNQAPPMPWATVQRVLTEQLGRPPEEAYASFDQVPLASASLGQVHRAHTHDGHEVAVKIQYPDIAQALKADLDNLGAMVSVMASSTRLAKGKEYYAEVRETMLDELDYRIEATRAKTFATVAASLSEVRVPKVYDALSTEKVLTLELLHGRTFKDFLNHLDGVPNDERFRVSRLLMRAVWGPFLLSGFIHADPHPGNFMVLDDGGIGVLDYGAVKQLSPGWTCVNRALFTGVCAGTPLDVVQLSKDCGFVFDDEHAARAFVTSVLEIVTRPPRTHDFDFKQAAISKDMRHLFMRNAATVTSIKPPKESVQFFRAIGGLSQNLETLGAHSDFKTVYQDMLALIPSSAPQGSQPVAPPADAHRRR